ncbi:MAG: c-type cytochrome [Planctomycetes bacterium]|nr:c-type cytochrome [Planctomycetota bacterium]
MSIRYSWLVLFALWGVAGCGQTHEVAWNPSSEVRELTPALQAKVTEQLTRYCGTPSRPRQFGQADVPTLQLVRGMLVYQSKCAGCHGDTGDGQGPAAAHLNPRPRDYRKGIFKFISTPFGTKPLRGDLARTIRQGARGTSMPSFALLDDEDVEALVDYVLLLTHRGELEALLANEARDEDAIDPANGEEYVAAIRQLWQASDGQQIYPLSLKPKYTMASVELGKQAFLSETAGCYKCHGPDGRAETSDNQKGFTDAWGVQTRAADLTSGMFHGGQEPLDIYRRIYGGINGTPMPSFSLKLADQPDMFWHLVHYVQYVSSARRRETQAEQQAYLTRAREAASQAAAKAKP